VCVCVCVCVMCPREEASITADRRAHADGGCVLQTPASDADSSGQAIAQRTHKAVGRLLVG
jgi:hypothetical protein